MAASTVGWSVVYIHTHLRNEVPLVWGLLRLAPIKHTYMPVPTRKPGSTETVCDTFHATIAKSHPQAAYATYTHGFTGKWSYPIRTIPNILDLLQPLEDAISQRFLSILKGKAALSDLERALFALPTSCGGLSIPKPTDTASIEFESSCKITAPIVDTVVQQISIPI